MKLADGLDVIVNTGGPDIPGVVEWHKPPNPNITLQRMVRVRFSPRSASWLEPENVRIMVLEDYRRIHGYRFCDWQYQLWYTLIFHYAEGFETLHRDQLKVYWQDGWLAGATAKRLAADHRWECLPL